MGSKHLKMAGQASVCWFKFTLGVRNAVKDGISHQGGSRRKGQGHLPGATKLIPAAIYPIHKQTQKICNFRGTNKGRRRQKRRCRKTCSQSGARIGATDILSCLKIYNCDTELLLFQKFHGLRLGNGGARKRTSQEEGDLQVRRNMHHILKEQCLPIVTRELFLKNIL